MIIMPLRSPQASSRGGIHHCSVCRLHAPLRALSPKRLPADRQVKMALKFGHFL